MVPLNNVRTAIQKFRSWRAQKQLAKEATRAGKRKKHERLADQSKRDFLAACGRASIIPGIALAGGIPLTYHLLTKKSETKEASSVKPKTNTLKTSALNILKEAKEKKLTSQRYRHFIDTIIRLIEEDKIHFTLSNKTTDLNIAHEYHPETNTVEMNTLGASTYPTRYKSHLIHELFHAYQDFQGKPLRASVREAEAHLANCDYLYHRGRPQPETWAYLEIDPADKGTPLSRFNVPPSIIKNIRHANFSSPEYKKAIKLIGDQYIWMRAWLQLIQQTLGFVLQIKQSGMTRTEIMKYRKTYLSRMRTLPGSQILKVKNIIGGKGDFMVSGSILKFLGSSQILIEALWREGNKREAEALANKTFNEFKSTLQSSARISRLDVTTNFDGIN